MAISFSVNFTRLTFSCLVNCRCPVAIRAISQRAPS